MKTDRCNERRPENRFLLDLPTDADLITSVCSFCQKKGIKMASFSAIGTVSSATIGVYDAKQQVFVTHTEKDATEMLSCIGSVLEKNGKYHLKAKIILADQQGRLTGGHLFSDTLVSQAEIVIHELFAGPNKKESSATTGCSVS